MNEDWALELRSNFGHILPTWRQSTALSTCDLCISLVQLYCLTSYGEEVKRSWALHTKQKSRKINAFVFIDSADFFRSIFSIRRFFLFSSFRLHIFAWVATARIMPTHSQCHRPQLIFIFASENDINICVAEKDATTKLQEWWHDKYRQQIRQQANGEQQKTNDKFMLYYGEYTLIF